MLYLHYKVTGCQDTEGNRKGEKSQGCREEGGVALTLTVFAMHVFGSRLGKE